MAWNPALSTLHAQTRQRGKERGQVEGGRPELQAGRQLGLGGRQMSAAPVGTPPHTGPRADSDLRQNQQSGLSLTSWPGHSVTPRPPRRVPCTMSPSVSGRDVGWQLVTAAPRCLTAPCCLPGAPPGPRAPEEQLAGEDCTRDERAKATGSRGGGCPGTLHTQGQGTQAFRVSMCFLTCELGTPIASSGLGQRRVKCAQ